MAGGDDSRADIVVGINNGAVQKKKEPFNSESTDSKNRCGEMKEKSIPKALERI